MTEQRVRMKDWLGAFRLRTLPLASACILTGSAIGFGAHPVSGVVFCLALITAWLLQVLSNLANDLGDAVHGADSEGRIGPKRAVQSGRIPVSRMKRAILVTGILAFVSGFTLIWIAFVTLGHMRFFWIMLLLGLLALAAAYRYTAGKNPYGYRGWGDVSVFVFFGLIGVFGSAFLYTASWPEGAILPAIWIGLQSVAVLNLNNLRDHENDKRAGKRTIVVRIGYRAGKGYHSMLVVLALSAMGLFAWLSGNHRVWMVVLLWALFAVVHLRYVWGTSEPAHLDPELKKVALATFFSALIFFITLQIP